ncbi:MAG: NAD(P)/FAD-dependent oxidoreductase [Planctomycetes bacterium]|nr:NAD(P)/FAD-dependent oxidoreductase [Planctomycetota bacterium]
MGKRIVILGAGSGGLVCSHVLRKKLNSSHEIVVVDRQTHFIFQPSLLWLLVGMRRAAHIQRPLSFLQKKGINYINSEVRHVDFDQKEVHLISTKLKYDYLVISLGASLHPEKIPGLRDSGHNLYEINGADNARKNLELFKGGKIAVIVCATPYKCPPAPYEASMLLSSYFNKKKIRAEIELLTPEPAPVGTAGAHVSERIVSLIQERGVSFMPKHQISFVDSSTREVSFSNGKKSRYEIIVYIPPHGLPSVLNNPSLLTKNGWVKTNSRTMETDIENVYAVGDATEIILPVGKPLPKAGAVAKLEAIAVADNIASNILGKPPKSSYDGSSVCFVETGEGRAGLIKGNFYAEPAPKVKLKEPSMFLHWGKILFERSWFYKYL